MSASEAGGVRVDAFGFARYGGPEVLHPLQVVVPAPGPGQVRIRVAATSVNPADTYLRSGRFRFVLPVRRPFVPGLDVAGVVDAVGAGVTRVQPGDAVFAALPSRAGGGYAGMAVVDDGLVAEAPSTVTLADAAAVPLVALTAVQGLRDRAGLRAGASVLVWGASGGVGATAVQVAAVLGGRVTAVTRAGAVQRVRGLGVEVVVRDASSAPLDGRRFDVVFDASGTLSLRMLRQLACPGGTAVTVNPGRGNPLTGALTRLLPGTSVAGFVARPDGADLDQVRQWIDTGALRPWLHTRLALDDAERAHRIVESREATGKVVLVVDDELSAARPGSAARIEGAE